MKNKENGLNVEAFVPNDEKYKQHLAYLSGKPHVAGSKQNNEIAEYKYTIRIECWKCGEVAEISNEAILVE